MRANGWQAATFPTDMGMWSLLQPHEVTDAALESVMMMEGREHVGLGTCATRRFSVGGAPEDRAQARSLSPPQVPRTVLDMTPNRRQPSRAQIC